MNPLVREAVEMAGQESSYAEDNGQFCESWFDPDSFIAALAENGYDIVPIVIIGVAGWTPREEDAYRMGYLAARAIMRESNPRLVEPEN